MLNRHPSFISPVAALTDMWFDFKLWTIRKIVLAWYLIEQPTYLVVAKSGSSTSMRRGIAYKATLLTPRDTMLFYGLIEWPSLRPHRVGSVPADAVQAINWYEVPLLQPYEPSP